MVIVFGYTNMHFNNVIKKGSAHSIFHRITVKNLYELVDSLKTHIDLGFHGATSATWKLIFVADSRL